MYSLGLYSITTARGLAGIVSLYVYANRDSEPEVTLSYFGTVRFKDILRIKKNSSTISIFARDDYNVSFSFLDLGGQVGGFDTNLLTDLKIYTANELSQFGDDYGNIYYNVADNVAHSLTVAGKTFNGSSDVNVDSIDCGEF